MWDKKNLLSGIVFIVLAILCVGSYIKGVHQSYTICGTVVFAIVAIAFLKRARK